jgi:TolB-like protein/DNA-binding winged helix-turn-helix (wHTH) protein/Tfp pilus assembly protein PilF
MAAENPTPRKATFGPYVVDLRCGELRKHGTKLKLGEQPVQILVMLLLRDGDLVTRDELQTKLWANHTFVDFDRSLNSAVQRLRDSLSDTAGKARWIETVPRRGYRFVGKVKWSDESNSSTVRSKLPPLGSVNDKHEDMLNLPVPREAGPDVRAEPFRRAGTSIDDWRDESPAAQPHTLLARATHVVRRNLLGVAGLAAAILAFSAALNWAENYRGKIGTEVKPIKSLAVLPLENLSHDQREEYLSDGMTDALITQLAKSGTLRVISRTSTMRYKGTNKSLPEIAAELKVDGVIEGSVMRSGERVRVTVHLAQASPERQLWSQEYDRSLRDVLSLQGEIARTVTDEIRTKLTPEELTRLSSARPENPEAQDDYLRGRYLLGLAVTHNSKLDKRQYTESDIQAAIGYFKHAIEKDTAYSLAYAGLADAYIMLGHPVWGGHSPRETLSDAKAAARRALALDPSLAEAHFSLAQTLEYDWNWSEAEREYRLALKLNPNYVDAYLEYGRLVKALGRNDEAMTQMNYATELDPFGLKTRVVVAYVTYASRQYDLAVEQFERLGDDWGMIWAYREKKMYPEAIAAWERWKAGHPLQYRDPHPLATIAGIYGLEGRKRKAEVLVDELKETARHRYVSGFFFAEAYIGIGQTDQAITWLERAYEEHDQWMVFANSYPGLDRLRSEPRFQALLRHMNFPQ